MAGAATRNENLGILIGNRVSGIPFWETALGIG